MKKTLIAIFPLFIIVVAGFFLSKKPHNELIPPQAETASAGTEEAISPILASATQAPASSDTQAIILDEILKSGNDNDPRLDKELKVIPSQAKPIFEAKYSALPAEARNERGTIVFLLGRNLKSENDIAFMGKVIREEPCRSMKNCREDVAHGDVHGEIGVETTLAYPQIMALKGLERILQVGDAHPLFRRSLDEVKAAANSPVEKISNFAKSLERKYSR